MLSLLGMFSRASAKLLATFVTVILLMIAMFALSPGTIVGLQDVVEHLDEALRNPPLNEQGTVLYRTLVNENTVFGILMTIIARAIVELVAWAGGSIWRQARGEDKSVSSPGPSGASGYYGSSSGNRRRPVASGFELRSLAKKPTGVRHGARRNPTS